MLRKRILAGVVAGVTPVLGMTLLCSKSVAQSFNFVSIDVPCVACPNGIAFSTSAGGINAAGDIVGSYADTTGTHGFLLSGGQFKTIDVPGELIGIGGNLPTALNAISPSGDIVGTYTAPVSSAPFGSAEYCVAAKPASCIKGFLYSQGKFSTVLFPLASGGFHPGSVPRRITPNGDIYGCLHDLETGMSMFGAVWTRFGGFSLTANGGELATSDPLSAIGVPMSMNNSATPDGHTIVGHWTDMTNHTHGFVVHKGDFQNYDVAGSKGTVIWDINPAGAFVGFYVTDKTHAFLELPDEKAPITLDVLIGFPEGTLAAAAAGINAGGAIVGAYRDAGNKLHGFLAKPLVNY